MVELEWHEDTRVTSSNAEKRRVYSGQLLNSRLPLDKPDAIS